MAEKDISTLIRRQQEITYLLKPLIAKQEEIKTLLGNAIKEIKKHHLDCNIARGVGAGAAVVGAGLAVVPAGQPVIFGVGLVVTLIGKLISSVTDVADEVISKTFNKNTEGIVALQNNLAENLKEKLNDFQLLLKTMQSNRSKVMLENIGLNLKERFGSQESSLVKSHSDLCGSISTDIDVMNLAYSLIDKCSVVKNLVDIGNMSEALLPKVVAALQAIGAIKEIEKVIQSWKKKHPSEEAAHKILERLLESITSLKRLCKDIEENVALLEKRLPVIKAIETYEEISGLVKPLILKQKETLDYIFKKVDKMSNKHRTIGIITGLLGLCMFIVGLAFVEPTLIRRLFEEGRSIAAATGFLLIIFVAFYGDKPSKPSEPAVEKMLSELKCPEYTGIKTVLRHRKLRHLLEYVGETSDGLPSGFLKDVIDFTPHKKRPAYEASKGIGDKIHGGFTKKESPSKQPSWMQGLLTEASAILEAVWKLDDIGYVIDCWAVNNNIKNKLVSQLPKNTIDYTESIDKLLEVLPISSRKQLIDKLQ